VYVTHDQVEAMTLGQRVAVLRDGVLQQYDTPQNLFRRPVNLFVAAFIGSPSMNFVHAQVGGGKVRFADVALPLPNGVDLGERQVLLGVRPTAFAPSSDGWPVLSVVPTVIEDLGDERYVIFDVAAPRVDTDAVRAALEARTADDALLLPDEAKAQFTIRLPADAPATVGEPLAVSIDPSRLYFFDPDSGAALSPSVERR
jgi:multiple sugar transport system ATP-binding protein